MTELIVETMDHCFLCLDQVPQLPPAKLEVGHESDLQNHSVHSLLYLSRYLKMDLKKIFLNDGPTTTNPQLLDKVVNSNLKVKLFGNCEWVNAKFSKLYRQLERIQMELSACINLIHGKLKAADNTTLAEHFRNITPDCSDEVNAKIKIADVLRIEAMTKCHAKVSIIKPKVRIKRLTSNQVDEETLKLKTGSQTQVNLDPLAEVDLKIVKLDNDPDSSDDGNSQEWYSQSVEDNDELDRHDSHSRDDDHTRPSTTTVSPKQIIIPGQGSSIDSGTGRVKCSICFKTFKNNRNFRDHYKNIHICVRHRCKTCGQVFSQAASLRRHTRTIHQHIKQECPKCHRSFNWSIQLVEHLKRPSCESTQTTYCKCHICGQLVNYYCKRRHMKRFHFESP